MNAGHRIDFSGLYGLKLHFSEINNIPGQIQVAIKECVNKNGVLCENCELPVENCYSCHENVCVTGKWDYDEKKDTITLSIEPISTESTNKEDKISDLLQDLSVDDDL